MGITFFCSTCSIFYDTYRVSNFRRNPTRMFLPAKKLVPEHSVGAPPPDTTHTLTHSRTATRWGRSKTMLMCACGLAAEGKVWPDTRPIRRTRKSPCARAHHPKGQTYASGLSRPGKGLHCSQPVFTVAFMEATRFPSQRRFLRRQESGSLEKIG